MTNRINIPRDINDPHYRYTREPLKTVVAGSGNGIHTRIINLESIGRDLKREPIHLLKFFSIEVATMIRATKIKDFIINGKFASDRLEKALDIFIDKYVLCGTCKNPETHYKLKGKNIHLECISCGSTTAINMKPKYCDFLYKELKKGDQVQNVVRNNQDEQEDDPAHLFASPTDPKSIKARRDMLTGTTETKPEKINYKEKLDRLLASNTKIPNLTLYDFRNKLVYHPDELSTHLLSKCLAENILQKFVPFIKRFKDYFEIRRYQKSLITSLADYIVKSQNQHLDRFPNMLLACYQQDCLDEDIFIEFYEALDIADENYKKIKLSLVPLYNWLKEDTVEEIKKEDTLERKLDEEAFLL